MHPYWAVQTNTLLSRITTVSDAAHKNAMNYCFLSLVSSGVWAKRGCIWVYANATSQAALLNWKDPTRFTTTVINAPTFTADRGYTGVVGTTSWLNTNLIPSNSASLITQNDASFGCWVLTVPVPSGNNECAFGIDSVSSFRLVPRDTAGTPLHRYSINDIFTQVATSGGYTGWYYGERTGATALTLYRNDVATATQTTASVAPEAGGTIRVCGALSDGPSNLQVGIFAVGGSLTAAQRTAEYNAFHTYMQTIAGVA